MSTIGLVGGIAPESTIAYYRLLVAGYRARFPEAYPTIVINSIDLTTMLGYVSSGDRQGLASFLSRSVQALADAGASLAAFASNTPHLVFDAVATRSPIPLLSIVEVAAAEAVSQGYTSVGLLGNRFTMEADFYPKTFQRHGVRVELPSAEDRAYAHQVYFDELAKGVFRPETRAGLLRVIDRLCQTASVQAVVLGGTELPLSLGEGTESPVPLLDTTRIHTTALLRQAYGLS